MRLCGCSVMALALLSLAGCASTTADIAIVNANVIDVARGAVLPRHTVLIRGDQIVAVAPARELRAARATLRVNGAGKYLIPGLWDMHLHLTTLPENEVGLRRRAIDHYLPLLLAHGVTGVRDPGGVREVILSLRRDVESGAVAGPRIMAAGPALSGPTPWGGNYAHALIVESAEAARAAVASLHAEGVDFIKLHDFLKRDVFLAAAEEARERKLPVAGHLHSRIAPADAAAAGVTIIEHVAPEIAAYAAENGEARINAFYDGWFKGGPNAYLRGTSDLWRTRDEQRLAAMLQQFRAKDAAVVPTLVLRTAAGTRDASVDRLPAAAARCESAVAEHEALDRDAVAEFVRTMSAQVVEMHRQGVRILAGTDAPAGCLVPGASLHRELEELVGAGLSPLDALRTATLNVGAHLRDPPLGRIAVGAAADAVLLRANPLEDIRNTRRIAGVLARGRWHAPTPR
jgi:imidazolonepropionase-like amidohydrolase